MAHGTRIELFIVAAVSLAIGAVLHFHMANDTIVLQPLEAFYSLPMVAVVYLTGGVHGAPRAAWLVAPYFAAIVQNLALWAMLKGMLHVARRPST
jgi:hypothetical protein